MNNEIAAIMNHQKSGKRISVLVSGESTEVNNTVFEAILQTKKPIVLIDTGESLSTDYWKFMKKYRVFIKPELFDLQDEAFLKFVQSMLKICGCSMVEAAGSIKYLQFIAYLDSLLSGKKVQVCSELIEKYSSIDVVEYVLNQLTNRRLINQGQHRSMLEDYGEVCKYAPKIEQLKYLIDYSHVCVHPGISNTKALYYLKLDSLNSSKENMEMQYALIRHCLGNLTDFQIVIVESASTFKDGIEELIANLSRTNDVALFTDNLFVNRDLIHKMEINKILGSMRYKFFGKHFPAAENVSNLFGSVMVTRMTICKTKNRMVKSNTLVDRALDLNTVKTTSYTPGYEPRYPDSEITDMDSSLAIYSGPDGNRYISV